KNYGWPCYEGSPPQTLYQPIGLALCNQLYAGAGNNPPSATPPLYQYFHDNTPIVAGDNCPTSGGAITGLSFYDGTSYPAQYQGALFFADYVRNCIWAILPGADGRPDPHNVVPFEVSPGSQNRGITNLEQGPGGDLVYVDMFGGTINRI